MSDDRRRYPQPPQQGWPAQPGQAQQPGQAPQPGQAQPSQQPWQQQQQQQQPWPQQPQQPWPQQPQQPWQQPSPQYPQATPQQPYPHAPQQSYAPHPNAGPPAMPHPNAGPPAMPQPNAGPPAMPPNFGPPAMPPPYPAAAQPQYPQAPQAWHQPGAGAVAAGASGAAGQPGASLRKTHLAAAVKPPRGRGFGAMAILSLRRALRLRIDANEVLDDERQAMLAAKPAIADETQQAFLAWRRSVLFMAALLMLPVVTLHAIDNLHFDDGTPDIWKSLSILEVTVEAGFALFLWTQVGRWTAWRRQSRRIASAWLVYFLTPFLVFLYPLASAIDYSGLDAESIHAAKLAIGAAIGAQAFVSLAPKIISLLQGLIRASIATKTLFPGASAPGWMMVIAAPLYMIIFYVFVLLPYHFTGSGLVVGGTLLVLAAKGSLVRAGLRLTRPMNTETARHATQRAQSLWMFLLISGIGCIVAGLWSLVSKASVLTLVNFGLSMGANILLLTLISTDALITGLDRARGVTPEERRLADETHEAIAAFTAVRVDG